ncbi:MAG: ketopantoate reductase family protein [Candidatus Asgardarchaeia archaeon]
MKVAVVGAGAIGSLFGALLQMSGEEVTLFGREWHMRAVSENGLKVVIREEEMTLDVESTWRIEDLKGRGYDVFLITVKAYDTGPAMEELSKVIKGRSRDFCIICLQNGIGVEEITYRYVNPELVGRGITTIGSSVIKPGVVKMMGPGEVVFGCYHGCIIEDYLLEVIGSLRKVGIESHLSKNIEGDVWLKTLVNCGINPFGAITGMKNGELIEDPKIRKEMEETVREGKEVCDKIGISLREDPVKKMIEVARKTYENENSMLKDIKRGKRTEIDFINGAIVNKARKVGVSTPKNELLVSLVKAIEEKRIHAHYPHGVGGIL